MWRNRASHIYHRDDSCWELEVLSLMAIVIWYRGDVYGVYGVYLVVSRYSNHIPWHSIAYHHISHPQFVCLWIDLEMSSHLVSVTNHINIAISMIIPLSLFIPISTPALVTAVHYISSLFLQHGMREIMSFSIWAFSKWRWRGTLRCSQFTGHLK